MTIGNNKPTSKSDDWLQFLPAGTPDFIKKHVEKSDEKAMKSHLARVKLYDKFCPNSSGLTSACVRLASSIFAAGHTMYNISKPMHSPVEYAMDKALDFFTK